MQLKFIIESGTCKFFGETMSFDLDLQQVILIHLSNITGLEDDYSKRTMRLLVSDIGTIVMGVSSALSSGYLKVITVETLIQKYGQSI